MSDDLTLELEKVVREAGGSGCGFSDLSDLQDLPYPGLTRGVTVLLALAPAIIAAIGEGPTRDYHDEYERANKELARIGFEVVRFLEKAGYRAGLIDPTTQEYDEGTLSAPFPHKTAALRAGVGWIGKMCIRDRYNMPEAVHVRHILVGSEEVMRMALKISSESSIFI